MRPARPRKRKRKKRAAAGRTNNDLTTPVELVAELHRFGTLALDPCSNPWSDVDALVAVSAHRGECGLAADWVALIASVAHPHEDPFAFVNPPYGRGHLGKWADKCVYEYTRGAEIIVLPPNDISTGWWRTLRGAARARVDFDRRLKFGGGDGAGKIRSSLFYFGPRPYLFAHVFAHHGQLTLGVQS